MKSRCRTSKSKGKTPDQLITLSFALFDSFGSLDSGSVRLMFYFAYIHLLLLKHLLNCG